MKPKLILLNGNPGMGKSTLAQRYIDEHPMTLNLDIDNIWFMLGGWQTEPKADTLRFKYAHAIADMHLAEKHDVIVPQIMEDIDRYSMFEQLAKRHNANMYEVLLLAPVDEAVERFKSRSRLQGFTDGFRPGGLTDTSGREAFLARRYADVLATIALRPHTIIIESVEHDIVGTYQKLIEAVN